MTKICIHCENEKPIEAFYTHPMMLDGHLGKCIECCRAYARERALANPGLDKRPFRRADIKKQRARTAAAALPKQPCEVCGEKAQAHHPDYDQPLLVRWLCRKHHGEVHRKYAA